MISERLGNLWQATSAESFNAPVLEGPVDTDLIIIGGGYTGLAAALRAAETGARVALVEAAEFGQGGSGRNVGLVNAGLWLMPETIEAQLGKPVGERLISVLGRAPERVFALVEEHGIACEPQRAGTLHLAHSARGLRGLEARRDQLVARGAPVSLLSAGETAARTGTTAFHGALHDPRAGTVQPLAFATGLARAAAGRGARLYQRSPAEALCRDGEGWVLRTARGRLTGSAVLLATNGYHMGFAGAPPPQTVAFPYFQIATPPLPEALRRAILPGGEGCWDSALVMTSIRTDACGRLIIGGVGNLDHPGGAVHAAWAWRRMQRLYPAARGIAPAYGWGGRIAMTGDHIPKVVAFAPSALAVYGYSGRGIAPGVAFGSAAADALLTGAAESLPIAPVVEHRERFTAARAAWFEAGALMVHGLGARM